MELKQILSVNFEDLTDDEKDELYTAIAWFDCDAEEIDLKKCKSFVKVSQEVLKYKGEQVETLLHELEEMAVKQGEEEAEVRSRKSSYSVEFENMEQKYLELKAKYKKVLRSTEKKDVEIERINKQLNSLERENRRLQNELESTAPNSESDASETIKDQQKELLQTIQNKNKQISDLLRDIEEVENENFVLKDKLSKVRDELDVATKEINGLTEILKEREDKIKELNSEVTELKENVCEIEKDRDEILKNKKQTETELNTVIDNCNKTIEDLKNQCKEKDTTITDLKAKLREPSLNSSISSLPKDEVDTPQMATLQKILEERNAQLMELKMQLQTAVKEMEESAETIKNLKKDKRNNCQTIEELEVTVKELKEQLGNVYERCRKLQDEVDFAEKVAAEKTEEVTQILTKLDDEELKVNVQELHGLKADVRLKERQIMGLVKVTNKLEESCDKLQKENSVLREQLGYSEHEVVNITSYDRKEKKRLKEIESLKLKLRKLEETNLELKTEIRKFNKSKPETHPTSEESLDMRALSEENEALRRGLHEILNSVNVKKSSTSNEIKSETLEKLLRALDVKHISGWYHPAMRLQAELHNLEGVNSELRNQLKEAKSHVQVKESLDESLGQELEVFDGFEPDDGFETVLEKFGAFLRKHGVDVGKVQEKLTETFKRFCEEDTRVKDDLIKVKNELKENKENLEVLQNKVKILDCETVEEKLKNLDEFLKRNLEVKRQVTYLENENKNLVNKLEKAYQKIVETENDCLKKCSEFQRKLTSVESQLQMVNDIKENSINNEIYQETLKNLNETTLKYRNVTAELKQILEQKSIETQILEQTNKDLQRDKEDMKAKLLKNHKINEIDAEIEKQRANHINNLYELVKEQLKKSEERFQEFSKYNEEIVKKNLLLQEQLNDAESKLTNFIDRSLYEKVQNDKSKFLKENEKLSKVIGEVEEALKLERTNYDNQKTWNDNKEQELLNLKHQIVDLVSISDEKVVISQLNNDILQCRQSQSYYRNKYKETIEELNSVKENMDKSEVKYKEDRQTWMEKELILNQKITNLQNLMQKQKLQYLGSIPLCSEENYLDILKTISKEKHETFLDLNKIRMTKNEVDLLKNQLELELNLIEKLKENFNKEDEVKNVFNWLQEKKTLQINELRYKRQAEFKEQQLQHYLDRIKLQDQQILKLEEELLLWPKNLDQNDKSVNKNEKCLQNSEVQTEDIVNDVDKFKNKICELENCVSSLKKQISDKQSQINFYERHIVELQNKKEEMHGGGDNISNLSQLPSLDAKINEEIVALKLSTKTLQENIKAKDEEIIKYQTLLKNDRDKHSLAAASLQEELQALQRQLSEEKLKRDQLEENLIQTKNKLDLNQYLQEVNNLEKHASDLHTRIASLETQLKCAKEEASRWRDLANDRLIAMEELGKNLDEQHKQELEVYQSDSRKLKEFTNDEINNLKQLLDKQNVEFTGKIDADIMKLVIKKDIEIQELKFEKSKAFDVDLNAVQKENEILKKRCEQLVLKEKNFREEIRELKAQLLKKPMTTVKTDKSIKEQLQKKVSLMENEIETLKRNLNEQISINESHKIQASEDFDKWKKIKYWQQLAEKSKNKLKEKDCETEKLQQTNVGYRMLIERLEREKHNLENRVKNLKSGQQIVTNIREIEFLKIENLKLQSEIETLNSKLEMSQHHSGGLGAAMMQEKLENQERKIAVLEIATKGTTEVKSELERLQATIANLQKSNLRLEAENLDLKLDLEKCNKDMPHLQQQVQHLESYIEILKKENTQFEAKNVNKDLESGESKRVSELERTVFILKRVVEKLQVENKRLLNGKRPISDRAVSADKVKRENVKLKQQYAESVERIGQLEQELSSVKSKFRTVSILKKPEDEKEKELRNQLEQKSLLLDKVKVLLHRAAAKEKMLLQEIAELKNEKGNGIVAIPEESESSSMDS